MKLRFSNNVSARWLHRVQLVFVVAILALVAVGYGASRLPSMQGLVEGILGNPLSAGLNAVMALMAVVGAFIMLSGLSRAREQEDLINRFFRAMGEQIMRGGPSALAAMPLHELPQSELSERLDILASAAGNNSRIDPATLAEVLAEREQGRVAVARYIASSLVLLGLLGTFIGLVITVNGVTQVVATLDIGQNSDMTQFMGQLKEGIRQPLEGMGLAFSTSLVGLASSLVLGVGVLGLSSAQASWTGKLEEITALCSPTSQGGQAGGPRFDWPKDSTGPQILEKLIDASHFLHGLQKSANDQLGRCAQMVEQSAQSSRSLGDQIRALSEPLSRVDQHYRELCEQGKSAHNLRQQSVNQLDALVQSIERTRGEQREALSAQEQALRQALSSFNAGVVQTLDARRNMTAKGSSS